MDKVTLLIKLSNVKNHCFHKIMDVTNVDMDKRVTEERRRPFH